MYILCNLAVANLFFIITAIQFWASDYLRLVLKIDDTPVFISFAVCCITGPTAGVLFGGFVVHKIGGYESKYSLLVCLIFSILASACALPIVLFDTLIYFDINLWLLLFFGGGILPTLTGIYFIYLGLIISSLPNDLKAIGNSVTSVISSLLGYLPAPFLYGYLFTIFEAKGSPRAALFIIMCYSATGVIFITFATIIRIKNYKVKDNVLLTQFIERNRSRSDISSVTRISAMLAGKFLDSNTLERIEDNEKERDISNDNHDNNSDSDCNKSDSNEAEVQENNQRISLSKFFIKEPNKIDEVEEDSDSQKRNRNNSHSYTNVPKNEVFHVDDEYKDLKIV